MFVLKKFIMDTLEQMARSEPEYKIREYALGWFSRSVLTEDDLAELERWYAEEEGEDQ